jgi:hypothetical protein
MLGQEKGFLIKKEREVKVEKTCSSKKFFGPLKTRTKTLKDLKNSDSTKNLEKILDIDVPEKDAKAIRERIQK